MEKMNELRKYVSELFKLIVLHSKDITEVIDDLEKWIDDVSKLLKEIRKEL